jgi:hypothetical protein
MRKYTKSEKIAVVKKDEIETVEGQKPKLASIKPTSTKPSK